MTAEHPRPARHQEIESILETKGGGVEAIRDESDKYTVVGAADRSTYANWLTPIEEHFVCHRNDIPAVEGDEWVIRLSGELEGSIRVTELKEDHPTVAVAHTMECAGNGRGQHRPETGSVQWGCNAVGTAMWTGTPLRSVLSDIQYDAAEDQWLTAIGGDVSEHGDVFARSIPLRKVLDDCILAYGMNGRPLPPEHGHPVRLIVPGWYGVNNVKWVEELRLMDSMVTEGSLDRPGDHAYWHQRSYRIHPPGIDPPEHATVASTDTWDQLAGEVDCPYTFEHTVMSVIGRPDGTTSIDPPTAGSIEVRGVAWAGEAAVERVDVSVDGGTTWDRARLFGPEYPGAWRLFRYEWDVEPGTYQLLSRATDDRGRRQPRRISQPDAWIDALDHDEFPWNEGGYAANAYEPNGVEVTVSDWRSTSNA